MRIHHFTVPAHDPDRVAAVLAEVLGGRVVPLPHPEGTRLVYAGDADGSVIEVWPAATRMGADKHALVQRDELSLPEAWPHHAYVTSDACDADTILAVFAREGWWAEKAQNGSPRAGFSLVRGRIENQTAIELGGTEMRQQYEHFFQQVTGGASVNKLLKRSGLVVGGLVGTVLVLYAAAAAKTSSRLSQTFETHRIGLPLPPAGDTAAIERGKHLVESRYACMACHGANLAGGVMIDEAPIGSVRGPNLTLGQGGHTATFKMADWDRIVRHGVKPDGTGTLMPSEDFFKMSDAELSDIVAFVRSMPAVDNEVPLPQLGPVGKVLVALGKLPISAERQPSDLDAHPSEPPTTADNAEFGAHLAATCTGCHRSNLAGGPIAFGPPDWPAAANLTSHASGLGAWAYDDFERALTAGTSKDGHQLREPMGGVVAGTKVMSETERKALWTYLRSLTPTATNDG